MGREDRRMIFGLPEFMLVAGSLVVLVAVCILRAVLGPTAPDRVVALDTTNTLVTATLVVLGVAFGNVLYVDVAFIYAMLAFVTTLYISRHLEGGK